MRFGSQLFVKKRIVSTSMVLTAIVIFHVVTLDYPINPFRNNSDKAYAGMGNLELAGDVDGDRDVDASDLAVMASHWLDVDCNEPNWCESSDIDFSYGVDLVDFSILLYWWEKENACTDQNQDGIVNLQDFSIMMYYWTG